MTRQVADIICLNFSAFHSLTKIKIGRINLLTPDRVLAAKHQQIQKGKIVSLK
jgi:hypothetical protein